MFEFIEVLDVEEIHETEDTYDITVENNHNFFANGMLVHNCLGGVYAGCYWENRDKGSEAVLEAMRDVTRNMVSIFGDRWYGELQWNNIPEQHELNSYVIQMRNEFGIRLVSTADSHYPNNNAWKDRELYKRLGWLGSGRPEWANESELPASVEEIGYELYPKNGDQMWDSYKKYSAICGASYDDQLVMDSITETHKIAFERIEAFEPDATVRLPDFVVPAGETADSALEKLSLEGLRKKELHTNNDYVERLRYELGVIADRGFSKYFLTMNQIAAISNEHMLTGPGRGSAAGSLVAYALEITQVDPIKYDLLFSRFLSGDFSGALGVFREEGTLEMESEAVEITLENGEVVRVSPELQVKINRNNRICFVSVKELSIGDELCT
jgi:DNA polymerase III alpha subunit